VSATLQEDVQAATIGRERPRRRPRERHYGYLLPMVLVLGLVSIYPIIYSIFMSFHDWNWGKRFNFVGLANYRALLTDPNFWGALFRTIYFTVGAVSIELVLGLSLALAVAKVGRASRVVAAILLIPMMVSGIIVSVIWKIMLDPTLGVIPWFLRTLHLPTTAFLGDVHWAMPSIIGIDSWWQTAFVFIVLLAGVQSLPTDPLEAAEVDGAGAWQKFRYVTLPLLRPFIVTVLLFRIVDCLKVFAIIFGTTGGGPVRATEAVQVLTYRAAFKDLQMSEAMTIMVLFSIFILAVVMVFLRVTGRFRTDET
jgi:multiple sugar transport system permease protein